MPLEEGASPVVYNASKALSGHFSRAGEWVDNVFNNHQISSATLHANSAYMILPGLTTMELRTTRTWAEEKVFPDPLTSYQTPVKYLTKLLGFETVQA